MSLLRSLLYLGVCGIAAHWIGEALPAHWLYANRFPFAPQPWEREGRIYERLRIRRWKDRVPDMSRVCRDMVPKRFQGFPTAESARRLLTETCRAEAVHWGLCLAAPVIRWLWESPVGWIAVGGTVLGNLPFILIQRYNRPALLSLLERLTAREEKKRHANTDLIR